MYLNLTERETLTCMIKQKQKTLNKYIFKKQITKDLDKQTAFKYPKNASLFQILPKEYIFVSISPEHTSY